jgi:AraC family ethanolamine operon transcriptional activator
MNSTQPVNTGQQRRSLTLFDADALTESVRSSCFDHLQLEAGDFRAELSRTELGRLTLDAGCYSRKVLARGELPKNQLVVGCVLNSRAAGSLNGCRFTANDVVIFPEGSELDYVLPGGTTWASIQLPRALLEQTSCAEMALDRVTVLPGHRGENARLARLLSMGSLTPVVGQGSVALQPGPPCCPNEESILEQIRRTLDQHTGRRAEGRRPSLHRRMALVRRFEQQIKERIDAPLRIPDLCSDLGVSQRTLEMIVREETGLTPKQFATVLRLNAIRRQLLQVGSGSVTIAGIARHFGIDHLGRFAATYRRQFGERPSDTLRANSHSFECRR